MIVSGNTVYLAGVIGVDSEGKFVEGTIKDRTNAALQLAKNRLSLVGLDLGDGMSRLISFGSSLLIRLIIPSDLSHPSHHL